MKKLFALPGEVCKILLQFKDDNFFAFFISLVHTIAVGKKS